MLRQLGNFLILERLLELVYFSLHLLERHWLKQVFRLQTTISGCRRCCQQMLVHIVSFVRCEQLSTLQNDSNFDEVAETLKLRHTHRTTGRDVFRIDHNTIRKFGRVDLD